MRSNYKPIGRYVRLVSLRNKDLAITELKGINIDKQFMPSVANVTGTDLSKYKIVSQFQFAFNPMHVGRDEVLPISMLTGESPVIVSPAYTVFEIKNHQELLPEYLMMWCQRSEFDRNAWFTTDSSVRGGFSWEDFCEMPIPVPPIEKQKEIVREYNTIVERIKLNEQLCQKLEETAQALYKHWFVDFEFPISKEYAESIGKPELEGKPYKSSGGEILTNTQFNLETPINWRTNNISKFIQVKDGTHDSPKPIKNGYPLITSTHLRKYSLLKEKAYCISEKDYNKINERSKVEHLDILFSMIGTVGNISLVLEKEISFAIKNVGLFKTSNQIDYVYFSLFYLKSPMIKDYISQSQIGSTQSYISLSQLRHIPFFLPESHLLNQFNSKIKIIITNLDIFTQCSIVLEKAKNNIISKMVKMR